MYMFPIVATCQGIKDTKTVQFGKVQFHFLAATTSSLYVELTQQPCMNYSNLIWVLWKI